MTCLDDLLMMRQLHAVYGEWLLKDCYNQNAWSRLCVSSRSKVKTVSEFREEDDEAEEADECFEDDDDDLVEDENNDGEEDDGEEDDGEEDTDISIVAEADENGENYSVYGMVEDEDEEDDDMCFEDFKKIEGGRSNGNIIYVNHSFVSKDALLSELRLTAVRLRFSFRIYKSTKTLLVTTCPMMRQLHSVYGEWSLKDCRWDFVVDNVKGARIIFWGEGSTHVELLAMTQEDYNLDMSTESVEITYSLPAEMMMAPDTAPIHATNDRQVRNLLEITKTRGVWICVSSRSKVETVSEFREEDDEGDEDDECFEDDDDDLVEDENHDGEEDDGEEDADISIVAEADENDFKKIEGGRSNGKSIYVNQSFVSKDALLSELRLTAVRVRFSFRIYNSTKTLLVTTCPVSGCQWKIRASVKHGTNTFWVTKYVENHKFSVGDRLAQRRHCTPKYVGRLFIDRVGIINGLNPHHITDAMKNMFGMTLDYTTSYIALLYAQTLNGEDYSVYGKVEDEDEEDDDMCFEDFKKIEGGRSNGNSIYVNQSFVSKDALLSELRLTAVRFRFSFRIYKSTKTLLVTTCPVSGCQWKIRASVKHGTNTFWVTKYVEKHTCSVGDRLAQRRHCTPKYVGRLFIDRVGIIDGLNPQHITDAMKNIRGVEYLLAVRPEIADTMTVQPIDGWRFFVKGGKMDCVVDLEHGKCDCGVYAVEKIPCSHAIAAGTSVGTHMLSSGSKTWSGKTEEIKMAILVGAIQDERTQTPEATQGL
ncbi:hypothetical protein F2Q69_00031322 [Brassica cretica]|uniref:SWIM-type domain-containing protein n=1 Tax=Brassica cretica TaxID=69181 RepID=A0A8S9S0I7_BRACR|nr:hypothetical protein F2Q69_00031322 [Brassica cretica]